jgi:hypothetical protein
MVGEESLEMKAPGAICWGSKGRLKLSSKETKRVIQIQIEAIDVIRENGEGIWMEKSESYVLRVAWCDW